MISDTALREFKEIWLSEFGIPVPDDIAVGIATGLLTGFDAVYRPIKREWADDENEDEYPNSH